MTSWPLWTMSPRPTCSAVTRPLAMESTGSSREGSGCTCPVTWRLEKTERSATGARGYWAGFCTCTCEAVPTGTTVGIPGGASAASREEVSLAWQPLREEASTSPRRPRPVGATSRNRFVTAVGVLPERVHKRDRSACEQAGCCMLVELRIVFLRTKAARAQYTKRSQVRSHELRGVPCEVQPL